VSREIASFRLVAKWRASLVIAFALATPVLAQQPSVIAHVRLGNHGNEKVATTDDGVVIWLRPLDPVAVGASSQPKRQKLLQSHKTFEPHVLVVQVGSVVDFPNRDPFFHNVFSLFEGKRFDLGLYEAGATNSVRFDRVGVSFLFCNIHPEMSAVVVTVDTPYSGVSDASGKVTIANVPDGRYEVHYWSERGLPEALKQLTRVISISDSSRNLEPVQIAENPTFTKVHKNKYGQDYAPPPNTDYPRP
jgi:plastocyanin